MAEFIAITTQEEFDARIKERLDRAENKWKEKYEKYSSPEDVANTSKEFQDKIDQLTADLTAANDKITNHDTELAERDRRIAEFEIRTTKNKVAQAKGLSWDAVDFLHGTTEEEISESADKLKKITGAMIAPMRNNEPAPEDKDSRYRNLAKSLKK